MLTFPACEENPPFINQLLLIIRYLRRKVMQISKNKVVTFEYTLTDDQGEVLDSSNQNGPLSYIHGIGHLIPGLESALEGRIAGDKITAVIPPETGYGIRDEENITTVDRKHFSHIQDIEVGSDITVQQEGNMRIMSVIAIDEKTVTLDGNHPLAGMTLNFDVKVNDVREASEHELSHALNHMNGCGSDCSDCGEDGESDCGCGCC